MGFVTLLIEFVGEFLEAIARAYTKANNNKARSYTILYRYQLKANVDVGQGRRAKVEKSKCEFTANHSARVINISFK